MVNEDDTTESAETGLTDSVFIALPCRLHWAVNLLHWRPDNKVGLGK